MNKLWAKLKAMATPTCTRAQTNCVDVYLSCEHGV